MTTVSVIADTCPSHRVRSLLTSFTVEETRMEMTTADASKRSRAKASAAAAPKSASKRATRKQAAEPAALPAEPVIVAAPASDLTDMIATTAYFLAAERAFVPGHELEDWLEAERR